MTVASIRPFDLEDRRIVVGILSGSDPWKRLGYGADEWEKLFDPLPRGREAYVIETEGKVAGFAVLRTKFLFGDYLELFALADWARGRELGGRLLVYIESVVFARGTNLFTCVSDFNHAARRFYRKHGYDEIGIIPDFLIHGAGEILLRKTIGPARAVR